MWKRDDEQVTQGNVPSAATTAPRPAMDRVARQGHATIGPSIVIRGEVTGDEDLLIQGHVDGSVALGQHAVTVGDGGRVKAGITGRVITVEGAVEGDLSAKEQIVLRGTARVRGDLNAPRVVLEDGASFRGLVDMGTTKDLDITPVGEAKAEPSAKASAAASGSNSMPTPKGSSSAKGKGAAESSKPAAG